MSLLIEYIVRHEAGKLLREKGRAFCVPCVATFLRDALGTAYTKGQIEQALALTYKRSFVCHQCGKTAPCLGDGSGRS